MATKITTINEGTALTVNPIAPPPAVIDAGALLAQGIQHGLSVDALERLLSMRRELQAEQAKAAFFAALATFQAQIPAIPKSQTARVTSAKGTFTYRYADLADIQKTIAPVLAGHGLSVTFDTEQDQGGYVVMAKVHHTGGHSETTTFRVPLDGAARMNSTQAAGSALTYGRRYALTAALGIVTADEDDDAQSTYSAGNPPSRPAPAPAPQGAGTSRTPPPADAGPHPAPQPGGSKGGTSQTEAQKRRLEARMTELGLQAYRERIKAWTERRWGVTSLVDLTSEQHQTLFDHLDDFAERIAIEAEAAGPAVGAPFAAQAAVRN
ncbi:MAG TPA: ERF family protein [Chromatiaceae bacterium]|nr:ERF family protein [Chromatiaceae bacterium]